MTGRTWSFRSSGMHTPTATRAGTDVRVVRRVADLAAMEHEWTAMATPFRTPLLDHDWFLAAARTLYSDQDLRVVVVREGGVVTGIAPLVVSGQSSRRLTVIGACLIHEPGGWLYASDDVLNPLTLAVLQLGKVGALRRLPPRLGDHLQRLVRGRGVAVIRPARPTLGVETAGGWDAHLARLSPAARKERKHMQARMRRIQDQASIVRVQPSPADIPALMDEFVSVEAAGWKSREGSALAQRPDMQRFYRTYLAAAAARGRVVCWTLRLGSEVAAMEIDLEAYGRRWSLKMGHDERYGRFSPGLLLADASIQAVFEDGLDGYEFLGAAEPWQQRWAPVTRDYRSVTIYPFSSRGLLGLGSDTVQYLGRRIPIRQPA